MLELAPRARRLEKYDTGPAHWARSALDAQPGPGAWLVAVVRLAEGAGQAAWQHLTALSEHLVVPDHERRRAERLLDAGALGGASVIAYVKHGADGDVQSALGGANAGHIETLLPGAAGADDVPFAPDTRAAAPDMSAVAGRAVFRRVPILGIVDDEIGYLNKRFCIKEADGDLVSRVKGVWVQARAQISDERASAGHVIAAAQISDMLAQVQAGQVSELAAYRRFMPEGATRGLAPVTHGTHVLDLAAGFDPEAAPDIPIFAVDMPGHTLRAPGSRRGQSYLIQGIRWLIEAVLDHIDTLNAAALAGDDGSGTVEIAVPDIVLTCSIGSYAGPKDGTGLYARLVAEELDRVNAMRTQDALGAGYSYRATLFQSFGNAYATNQTAQHSQTLRAGPLDWHLPRADRDSSLLELRVSGADVTAIWLRLGGADFEIKPLKQGQYRQISKGDAPIARIYRERNEAGGRQLYSILVRPTDALQDGFACAPAGPLRVAVDTDGPADVLWQVERDDVPFGYAGEGKQSWLGDALSQSWDPQRRAYVTPDAGSAVLRMGSETAQAHTPHPSIVTVGAAMADDPVYPPQPSSYSAAGSPDRRISTRMGPDVSATGDDAPGHAGVLASGTHSGSVARLAGTSVAAPQAARRMLLTGAPPEPAAPLSARTGPRYEDRSGARDARLVV